MIIKFHDVVLIYSFVSIFIILARRNVMFVRNLFHLEVTCWGMSYHNTERVNSGNVKNAHEYSQVISS